MTSGDKRQVAVPSSLQSQPFGETTPESTWRVLAAGLFFLRIDF